MSSSVDIERVSAKLQAISDLARDFESRFDAELLLVHPKYRESATNLVHYLALRETDIRDLQEDLAMLGLSSLGRAERNVMASIAAVRMALQQFLPGGHAAPVPGRESLELRSVLANQHRKAMLGDSAADRDVSIMVTLPSEAADNFTLVREMIAAGMNVARINCAHDDQSVWTRMIDNVRKACKEADSTCRVFMDLAGPKIRTGDLRPGPRVFHVKPRRDPMGRTVAPRRVRLIPDDVIWRGTKVAVVPVPRECVEYAHEGDDIRLKDTRGKKRKLRVIKKDDKGLVVETLKGVYIATGSRLRLIRGQEGEEIDYSVGELPSIEQPLLLRPGDTLYLTGDDAAGGPAVEDADGGVVEPARISCRQPEVFQFVSIGDRVSLNDGKIAGIVRSAGPERLEIEISKAKPTGSRLRGDRGVNFPDTDIRMPGLTAADKANLRFVVDRASAVGLSFVKKPGDIVALQDELDALSAGELGLFIKIETKKSIRNLPQLLLTAMRRYPAAVMIARGDLAVECGWERLAELQEEILWLCEAAQLPVIWATQVLELTTKKGQPSRAEISDAAMSQRADCVMLNKGPHILAAIRMLDDILRRMQGHQYKKTARLGRLRFADES